MRRLKSLHLCFLFVSVFYFVALPQSQKVAAETPVSFLENATRFVFKILMKNVD